jgi:PAS domain S-box-containing protein
MPHPAYPRAIAALHKDHVGMRAEIEAGARASLVRWRGAGGVLLFLAYVATAGGTVLFVRFAVDPSLLVYSVAVPWLPVGVGVAGVLLGGARLWPALFIGSCAVWGGLVGHSAFTVTVDAAAEAASVVLIVHLLSLWGFHRSFDRLRDPLVLLAAATIGRLLAVTVDDLGLALGLWLAPGTIEAPYRALATDLAGAAPRITPQLLAASLRWALNSIAGIVLVVPVLVARPAELVQAARRQPAAFAAWGVALIAWATVALSLPAVAARLPLLVTALLLVAWAAIRFGVAAAAIATLALSLLATVGFGMRLGPLATGDPTDSVEELWGFIAMLAVAGLLLAVLLAERRRELEQLTARAERYLRLFRHNPSPLWVTRADGRILMVNDQAIRHYGYSEAEFLGLTLEQLATGLSRGAAPDPAVGARPDGARTLKHRTRAGKVIDVELVTTPIDVDGGTATLCYALDVTDRYALRLQLLAAADLERRRLAQELHDGLGQVLTGLNLGAQGAALRAARGAAIEPASVGFLVKASAQAAALCRELTRGVSPLQNADGDLLEALRRLPDSLPPEQRARLEVVVAAEAPVALSLARREHLYRVAQEAVTNALKHARARRIRVVIGVSASAVDLAVEDDGVGVGDRDAAGPLAGLGVRSMMMRAAAVGGRLDVAARDGGGTVIRCACPQLEQPDADAAARACDPDALAPPPPPAAAAAAAAGGDARRRLRAWAGRCLVLAAGCVAALAVSTALARIVDPSVAMMGPRMAIPSLLTGLSVGALLLGGAALWPGVALGACVGAGTLIHLPWPYAIYYGADQALTALIALWLLTRWRFARAFDRWQDPLLLLGAAVIACSASRVLGFVGVMTYQWLRPGELPPAMTALVTAASGATPVVTGAFLSAIGRWWADGVAGVVLAVPVVAATPPLWRILRERHAEAGIFCAALGAWLAGIATLSDAGARWPLVTTALVLLIWAAVRLGVAWACAATFICAMAATASFALQRGVLATIGADEGISALWGFLALLTVTGLTLTALLAERNRILAEIAAVAERNRRVFELDPHPLWVEDVASGRILLANAEAERHYGYSRAEWLAMTAERLAADAAGAPRATPPAAGAPLETRHRLKSGALIDVELWYAPIEMEGRPARLCFAIDVSERNSLRRGFLEATDLERHRLGEQLGHGLGRPLAELEDAAARFQRAASSGRVDPAAIELVANASRDAAGACRRIAHAASPLQANDGDLVGSISELAEQLPATATARIDVKVRSHAAINLPLEQCEHLYGLVRGAVMDAATNARARQILVSVDVEPALIRVAIEDDGRLEREQPQARMSALQLMMLRATSMGARLRQSPRAPGGRTIVCECPQPTEPV